jgi:NAD(P)-dependent dehydrogenase (short-subunit alcohol dehydrogenase family)
MSESAHPNSAELRFDGRVAVVTGAGRGLGRAYAELLASRGAQVVVNDLGSALDGSGENIGPAQEVVDGIRAAGGSAVASTDSVASEQGGRRIIDTALDHFGRIDILIHNAGNTSAIPLREMSLADFDNILNVHLRGGFNVTQPAYARMCDNGYGRIVLTASVNALYGNYNQAHYTAAKSGLWGLANVAALEGATFGVKANTIVPTAVTRMAAGVDTSIFPPMTPDMVSPMVGWMAHESCSISGEMLISVAGRVARGFACETRGIYRDHWTIEDVADHIDVIRDRSELYFGEVIPAGQIEHLKYSFAMQQSAETES